MTESTPIERKADRLKLLTETGPGTPMGRLLRRFWHPVARIRDIRDGVPKPIRILGEDLTVYRGKSGRHYVVGARCAHRSTVLHTGWIEGETIRCVYHGWRYDGLGRCVERPAEGDAGTSDVKIAGYPVHEYCGLVFAYMGEGAAPEFELPRKQPYETSGAYVFPRTEIWNCNWFQNVENSLDAVHVSFTHRAGKVGMFGEMVTAALPKLEYLETESGIRQIATRPSNIVRVSDWTFPNSNHINMPGPLKGDPWLDVGTWVVPIDDERTLRVEVWVVPSSSSEADRRIIAQLERYGDYEPAEHHDELFRERKFPEDSLVQLVSAQDYVARMGQGTIVDRTAEWLGKSDAGLVLLRKICWREMDSILAGREPKRWQRLAEAAHMPIVGTPAAAAG